MVVLIDVEVSYLFMLFILFRRDFLEREGSILVSARSINSVISSTVLGMGKDLTRERIFLSALLAGAMSENTVPNMPILPDSLRSFSISSNCSLNFVTTLLADLSLRR